MLQRVVRLGIKFLLKKYKIYYLKKGKQRLLKKTIGILMQETQILTIIKNVYLSLMLKAKRNKRHPAFCFH